MPNQTDDKYYTVDIGCSTDIALHSKHYQLQKIFDFFNLHPQLKSTFATKYPTRFDPNLYTPLVRNKNRIRVSLMPQKYSSILEPNTDSIADRIGSIHTLQEHMEVHINFSPVVFERDWRQQYNALFRDLWEEGIDVPCEVIMLTYNEKQAAKQDDTVVKHLLYKPHLQEAKDSQYAPDNLRYHGPLKAQMVEQFKEMHSKYFKSPIRYIF